MCARHDLVAFYAGDLANGHQVRFMHFDEPVRRQAFFNAFESKVGDVLFIGGMHGHVVLQRLHKNNIVVGQLYQLVIGLDKNVIFLSFVEISNGLPVNLDMIGCTLPQLGENCKIIAKDLFKTYALLPDAYPPL